jgi:protocatechuate 3,4-dioxygenase beta subunit
MCVLGSIPLFVAALLLLLTAQVWAQGPEYFAEYILHLQPPDKGIEETTAMWFWTRHILSDLKTHDLVLQFECVEEENLVNVLAGLEGLYQLQELEWVVKIEQQTDFGLEVVYDARPIEQVQGAAPLAPNDVTGIVDLPDATPVEGMWVYADQVDGWGWDSTSTNASGAYTLTLDEDGWWDIYLGSVPWTYSGDYARPLDWSRRLSITSDIVQNFSLLPISYTITGTVRMMVGTAEILVQWEGVNGYRVDGGHDVSNSTDFLGVYELGVSAGTYTVTLDTVTFSSDGYAPLFQDDGEIVVVSDASVGDVDLWMYPLDQTISGTVTDKDTGEPIGDARLDLDRADGLYLEYNIRTETSGLTGTYAVSVTDGVYLISLDTWGQPSGYALPVTDTQTITVSGSNVPGVNFQLVPLDKHIRGQVTDKDTGVGVSGANMYINAISGEYESYNAVTDASGYYTFTVTGGEYDVNLPWTPPSGYARPVTTTQRVIVTTGDVSGVDFVLLPKNRSVGGRVTIRDTETGVEGVQMRLYSSSPYVSVYTETTSAGYYTFTEQTEGDYTVCVEDTPPGYVASPPASLQVEVTATNRSGVNFEMLVADKTIRGTVGEAGGDGLAGVHVNAYSYDTDYTYYPDATTDANGAYTLTVPAGYFRIEVSLPSGYAGRQRLRAPAGASGVDFALQRRSQTITGQVTDYHPTQTIPLPGVFVYAENYDCYTWDWSGYNASATTDASGYYTLTVIPGSYEVRATKMGYPTPPYQDAQSGDSDVNFTMPEGFVIRGQVTGVTVEGGTLVLPNAYVYAYNTHECASSRHDQSTSANANGYYTLTVDAGTYAVSVGKSEYASPPAQSVTVGPDQSDVDFEMSPLYLVTGTVRYPNGQPVAHDAWVRALYGPYYESDWTDADGQYEVYVISGTFHIAANINNWPDPEIITDVVVVTHTYNVDLTAPEAYTVTGTVRRNDGTPWEDKHVRAKGLGSLAGEELDYDYTDANGMYALHVHRGGTYLFYPSPLSTYPASPVPVSYTVSADMSGVDFQFGAVVTVTGMVSDTDGASVPNADVDIYGYGANGARNYDYGTYTFYDGTYITWFAEGSYDGEAEMDPCYVDSDEASFTLGAGGLSGVDFTITRKCGMITGQATGSQNQGVCDADVRVEYPDGSWFDTEDTAKDWHGQAGIGDYRVLVPVGTWNLWASKTGFPNVQPVSRGVEIAACGVTVTGQDFAFITGNRLYLPLVLKTQ